MAAGAAAALKGWWYGPLVELADAAAHAGSYVQLVVFVLQSNPSQIMKNIRNVSVNRAIILVGDRTRMYFKVVLWQLHADNDISAGDIIFLQNMKVREYKGQIEAVTVHHSTVKTLVQRAALLSFDEAPQKLSRGSCGPIVDEKLESVARWAKQTQMTLLSFLVDTPLHQDMSSPLNLNRFSGFVVSPFEHQAHSCEQTSSSSECLLLADAACCMKSCTMKFSAYIGEISLPFVHKEIKSATELAFASNHLLGDSGLEFIRALLCIGCTSCGSPLDQDHNRVYIRCTCTTQVLSEKGMGWIYRPFLVYVWDGSAQISILVRNKAAVKMFADIKAEDVFRSFSDNSSKNVEPECTRSGACHASTNVLESTESLFQQHSSSNNLQKDAMITTDIDKGVLLKHLLRILISKGNHSPFHFKVSCHIDSDADVTYRYFELISFRIGPH